jgi:GAF domain-containing protein
MDRRSEVNQLTDPIRIEALQRSGLLDRTVAQRLDHLAFAAARLLLADAALINGLDGGSQYTPVGWPQGEWPVHPVGVSGCQHVVLTGQPFVVNDALVNPVTCEMPWAERFRAYLGVPVCYDDHIIGSLCVLNAAPRTWKPYEIQALEGVSRLVTMSLEEAPRTH